MAKRDVELIIRARDEATKGISAIAVALDKLESTQNATGQSAVELAAEMAKLGSMGDAGKALKQINKDVEQVNKVLQRQEKSLAEAGNEVSRYTEELVQAKAKLDAFKANQNFVGPLPKKELREQNKALKELEGSVASVEKKLAGTQAKFDAQTAAVADTTQALTELKATSSRAATDVAKLAVAEQKITREADAAKAASARLVAAFVELRAKRDALANAKPIDATLGGGDAVKQVRQVKQEYQDAAAKLEKLRAQFRATKSPSADLARQIGEQAAATQRLYGAYQKLSGQAAAVVSASLQKQRASEAEAAAQQKAKVAADAAAAAQAKLAAQQAAQRTTQRTSAATETIRVAGLDNVGPQLVRQKQLQQAVMELKAAYTELDNELRRVQAASGPFGAQQDQLRAKMIGLKGSIQQGESLLRGYSQAAGQAGSSTSKLGAEAGKAAGHLRKGGQEANKANSELRKLILGTRQSLGLLQRIRGQFLAIGASYIGVFGAIDFTKGIANAQRDMDSIRNRFLVGFGNDQRKAAEELDYTRKTADELGLEFATLAKEYSKLTAASLGTNLEGENTRRIFKSVAQAARVLNISTDDTAGAFKAFSDIISKGTLQAEELKGQLGDRFPGAVQLMASSLGIGTEELMKMMEQGQLTSDSLVYFADAMAKRVAGALPEAVNTFDAQLQRLKNAWFEVQIALANSGFLDGIAVGLKRVTEILKDPEAIAAFERMGKSIGDLIVRFTELVANQAAIEGFIGTIDKLGYAIAGLLALVGGSVVLQAFTIFVSAVSKARVALALFTGSVVGAKLIGGLRILGGAVLAAAATLTGPMIAAIAAVIALLAAPFIAMWAYDNFPPFRKMVIEWGDTFQTVIEFVVLQIKKFAALIKSVFREPLATLKSQWLSTWGSVFNWLADKFDSAGAGDWAAKFRIAAEDNYDASKNAAKEYHAEIASLEENALADTVKRKAEVAEQLKKLDAEVAANAVKAEEDKRKALNPRGGKPISGGSTGGAEFSDLPPWKPGAGKGGDKKAKLTEEEKLANKVENKIEDLRQKLAELKADDTSKPIAVRLDAELAAIDSKYQEVFDDLTKLGKGRQSEEWKIVQALIDQEKVLARQKFQAQGVKEQTEKREEAEKRVNDLQNLRQGIQERIKFLQEQGDAQSVQQAEELKLKLKEIDATLLTAIDDTLKFLEGFSGPEIEAAKQNLLLLRDTVKNVGKEFQLTAADFGRAFGEKLGGFADSFIDKIAETGDVLGSLKDAFRDFARSFLIEIAKMILKQAIFNALQAAGGSSGGFLGAAASAILRHDGGSVDSSGRTRGVSPALFSNAVRYHSGGIAGLKPNEVPAILERGEEVLTRDDPRNILNGAGGAASGGAPAPMDVKIVNTIDSGSFVSEGMNTSVGQKAVLNFIRANQSAVRSAMGV